MRCVRRVLASVGLCLLLALPGFAADYPSRAVKIVVGFAPGTGTDILARILAEQLHAKLRQPFIVENKPGAAAQIAADFIAHVTPDGYTLLLTSNASHSINPHLYRKLPYDPIADFTPIARAADFPLVLLVTPKLPAETPAQLVEYIRTHPVSFASPSRIGQVIVSALATQLSLTLNEIDYASSPAALQDVAAGREAFGVFDFASSQAFLKAGKLRAIAVTTSGRSLLAPDLPPLGEALGLEPTDLRAWTGFFGPAKLPYDAIDDFTPIARLCDFPYMLVLNPKLPIQTPQDLVAYARANAGKVSYAYSSRPNQVAGAALDVALHLDMNPVDYGASPPAMQDVAAGRDAFRVIDLAARLGLIKGGKLRPVAVVTAERSSLMPDMPPLGPELGLEGFDLRAWTGLLGPARLPPAISERLSAGILQALARPELHARLAAAGMEPTPMGPVPFARFMADQLQAWGQKVKAAGIEPE